MPNFGKVVILSGTGRISVEIQFVREGFGATAGDPIGYEGSTKWIGVEHVGEGIPLSGVVQKLR